MGEKKKCSVCLYKNTCIKLADYVKSIKRKNKFSRELCKDIKSNPDIMLKLIDLAMLG